MLAWLHKRLDAPWSRRTRWSPLLETQRELQRTLAKERARVDRDGGHFGFVILRLVDLHGAKQQTKQLAKILHRRLRDTDSKGHLGFGRFGVILPMTNQSGSELVMEDIIRHSRSRNIALEGEAFVYPGSDIQDRDGQGGLRLGEQIQEAAPVPSSIATMVGTEQYGEEYTAKLLSLMLPAYPLWKRMLDIVGAGVGLLILSPILLSAAIAIKLSSPGPVVYSQMRTGYMGRSFRIYKLRSMVVNADDLKATLMEKNERDGPAFKMRRDPRITLIGRILRATGLDELPQLINVLKGDMSLVGPRPLPINEAQQCLPWQTKRREVKPGLTCFWQISKSRQMTFEEWMRLDLEYVRRVSLKLDLSLILKTFGSVFLGRVGH